MICEQDGKTILTPTLDEAEVRKLTLGRQVYITGIVHVARDLAHQRIQQWQAEGKPLPFDLAGSVVFHAGPTVRRAGDAYEIINIGPTTSARMNPQTPLVIDLGVRAIVGKGAMDAPSAESMSRRGCVFLAAASGCAMVHAACIRRIVEVHWLDLGTTEAVWVLDVNQWGPLTVAMDAAGGNLFQDVARKATEKMRRLLAEQAKAGGPKKLDTELLVD